MIEFLAFSIGYVILGCLVVSITLLFRNWSRSSEVFRVFGYFLLWNLFIEITARIVQYNGSNNLPLLHLYTLGEMILFTLFYRKLYPFSRVSQSVFSGFLIVSVLLIIANSMFLQSVYGFNSYAKTFVQATLIAFAILFFYHLDGNQIGEGGERLGIRLINTGVLVYYSGSLFVFMFSDYLLKNGIKLHGGFWLFNAVLNLIFQILVLVGLWSMVSWKRKFSF